MNNRISSQNNFLGAIPHPFNNATIQQSTAKDHSFGAIINHQSPITNPPLTNHQSPLTNHPSISKSHCFD
jgi:hypothetical protein